MLDKIISFSIKNKLIIGLMTVLLIIWGLWSANRLPVDAVPDITNNQVQIITVCPNHAGQDVEQLVTYPIEQSFVNLPDIEELRSISRFGLSVVTVVFKEDVDVYFARQLILERLKEAESHIPEGVGKPELGPVSTGLGEVYQYIIHPKKGSEKKYTAMDLRTLQDWIVARQLYGTPGIAEVNSFGGLLKQYEVAVNPERLLAMGVSISDIFTALENNNENTGGAYIDKKPNAYFIRGIGLIRTFEDINNIFVKSNPNGIPILIKDVAKVQFGEAVRYGAMTYNGEVDAVGGVVMMLKGSNSAKVVGRIKEKMKSIQKSLPEDVTIEPFLDRTDLVNRAISTVETNLIEGALIVIFVLVLFLGNFRAGIIVASAIPLSMLFALGMMQVFNVSANLMSLGAIDFGLIVDGAVIIVEATLHHLGLRKTVHALSQKEMDNEVFVSASKIRNSAAFGEIIILIVYLPILSLVGIEGKMFGPMAKTVGFAIIGALILSLTYIPMMCAMFLSKTPMTKSTISDKMMHYFQGVYTPLLAMAIRFKLAVVSAVTILFAIVVYLFSGMGGEFIPTLEEGDYAFHCILPQGTSLSQSVETSKQACRIIKEFDEVKMVVGKTGSAEVPTDPMPLEATDMIIVLKNKKEWKRNVTYTALAQEIMKKLEVMPGVFFEINQPIQMRFNELMTGIREDVAIKIFGEHMDTLLTYANRVSALIRNMDGISEPSVERVAGLPEIVITFNRLQLANYGLSVKDVNHVISTAFAGSKAGMVYENERRFDLVVRLDSAYRNNIDDVKHLYIPTKQGIQIPLSQLADIKFRTGPAQISREDAKRRIVVGFNVNGRDVSGVVKEIQRSMDEKMKLPEGYFYTFGGTFENLRAATARLQIAVPVAMVLIFILLYFTFSSVAQAALIFTAIPMATIGGVFALMIRDMPFSISAGVGFIALFGVAVLNGIVLIATFNQLKKDGITDVLERVREGTRIRLRPVLMTAMVASLGFLPMALSHGAGAEVQKPLATVVIGGLVSATFLTLFVLPVLYILLSGGLKFRPKKSIALFIALSFFISRDAISQTGIRKITPDEAVAIALKNNPGFQSAQLQIRSSDALKKSVFELPNAGFTMQIGQYNSINRDKSFLISQSIPFPTYFHAKAGMQKALLGESQLQQQMVSNEIRSKVKTCYYSLQYLMSTGIRLHYLDSLYHDFVRIAELRYKTGETRLLEKTTAEAKRGEIQLMLENNKTEKSTVYAKLKSLLNSAEEFEILTDGGLKPIELTLTYDSIQLAQNPSLKMLNQQTAIAGYQMKMESAATLPDLSIGYFNQSLIGTQNINGTDVYYDAGKRFQGVTVGIGIPLTFFTQTARIKSLSYKKQALQKEAENGNLILKTEIENAFHTFRQNLAQYDYYRSSALPNADILIATAQSGYSSGDIGYLEYLSALENATEIQLNYLMSIHQLNQSVIHIQFLTNQ